MTLRWYATAPIHFDLVRAFGPGDRVPDSVVAAHPAETTGRVVQIDVPAQNPAVVLRPLMVSDRDTDAEREAFVPARLSDVALRASLGTAVPATSLGAKGDGTTDDTAALNSALAAAKALGVAVVDGGGHTYRITGRLTVDSVTLRSCTLSLKGVTANVRLTGTAPALRDSVVAADSTVPTNEWGADGGMVNLHAVTKALIDNVECTAATSRRAVQCITRADYTRITGLRTYTAWGILFNDTSFIDRSNIEGVDYSAQPIGTGLTVMNSDFFGPSNAAWTGDGIEINTPAKRFRNIVVTGCRVWKTYTSSSVGIGYGFANCDHLTVSNCYATSVEGPGGAYHAEFCTDVRFTDNTAVDCRDGMVIQGSSAVRITGNTFDSCWEFSFASQNTATATTNLTLADNTFTGLKTAHGVTAFNDVVISNAHIVTLTRNKLLGNGQGGLNAIALLTANSTGVSYVQIIDNLFTNATGFNYGDLAFFDPATTYLLSRGNEFTSFLNQAAAYINHAGAVGIVEDFYQGAASQVAGGAKGTHVQMGGNPNGWLTGVPGAVVDDVVNGARYKWSGTTWTTQLA